MVVVVGLVLLAPIQTVCVSVGKPLQQLYIHIEGFFSAAAAAANLISHYVTY